MPLLYCRATFKCDECDREFSVEMHSPSTLAVYEAAIDAVRGSVNYQGPRTSNDLPGLSSVEEMKGDELKLCLCGFCTHEADKRKPSKDDKEDDSDGEE